MAEIRMALTIDDLPWHVPVPRDDLRESLADLVAAIEGAGVPVTGFVNGGRDHLSKTCIWRDAGMPLGNHTWSHVGLSEVSAADFVADIARNETCVLEGLGCDLRGGWFRFPYLDHGDGPGKRAVVAAYLRAHGYRLAPVTINTCDYAFARHNGHRNPDERLTGAYLEHIRQCVRYFVELGRRLYGRDIAHVLLVHANELNARCLGEVIALLRGAGVRFISLDDALSDPAYAPFGTMPPEPGAGSRGDFLGDIAAAQGVSRAPDPSSMDRFREMIGSGAGSPVHPHPS